MKMSVCVSLSFSLPVFFETSPLSQKLLAASYHAYPIHPTPTPPHVNQPGESDLGETLISLSEGTKIVLQSLLLVCRWGS